MRSSSVRFNSAPERGGRRRGLALVAALWALAGCAGGVTPWDVGALERETPGLRQHRGHRLADISPHFWVSGGDLLFFLCTWPQDRPVSVALHGATGAEDALFSRALAALEGHASPRAPRAAAAACAADSVWGGDAADDDDEGGRKQKKKKARIRRGEFGSTPRAGGAGSRRTAGR